MKGKPLDPKLEAEAEKTFLRYKCLSYLALSSLVKESEQSHIEILDLKNSHDEASQIIVDCFWDDKPDGNIRLSVECISGSMKPLLGFIPIHFSCDSHQFIIKPDGSFLE